MRNSKLLIKSILISTLAISVIGSITAVCTSCGNEVHVTRVELNKASTALGIGATETLTATVLPETAPDKSVTWSSSNTDVATVDSNGTITAVAEGIATITVKTNDGGKTATCEVTVDTIHVTSVTLDKTSTTLAVGDTEQLTATVLPEDATDKSVTWTSSNTDVATVNSNGTITAKGLGNATITAASVDNPSVKATCEVTVDTIHVESVSLDKASVTLAVGKKENLIATVLPTDTTNKNVTWTSSNPAVATVHEYVSPFVRYGVITAVSEGAATITVTSVDNPNAKATCEVTVDAIHVTSVELNKTSTALAAGGTETLTATVSPADATDKSVTWTSSNPSVATVKDGVITAVSEGVATITVKTNDGDKTATCEVTVDIHVIGVGLNKISTTLAVDDTETLIPTVLPEDATNKDVTWTSSNSSVATVDNNGKITAVGLGKATITATSVDNPSAKATCAVTVDTIHVTGVTLNKPSINLTECQTETLTATVLPADATDKSVTWTSSNPSVATVNNGTITAVSAGTTTITVTSVDNPSAKATCAVNVNNSPYAIIIANEGSTLTLKNVGANNPNLQYSTDGTNWTTYSAPINIPQGQSLYLKGNNQNGWSSSTSVYSTLLITGNVSIFGNVMALLDNGAKTGEQGDITAIPCDSCFYRLFQSSIGITSVSKNFLPATSLVANCYSNMFHSCSFLTTAPDLPATSLADNCYRAMFGFCSSLTTVPDLPATTLANECYRFIFQNCASLNSIKIAFTGNYSDTYFYLWVTNITSSGTFYYNGSDTCANFGFPSGWTKTPF